MKIKFRFQYNSPVVLSFALASLAALRSMGLISPEMDRLELMPFKKTDPAGDQVFQMIQRIRNHAMGKGD